MVRRILVAGIVALTLTGRSAVVCGQEDISQPAPPTKARSFFSDLRNNLFGGVNRAEPQPIVHRPAPTALHPPVATRAPIIPQRAPTPSGKELLTTRNTVTAPGDSSLVAKRAIATPDRFPAGEQSAANDVGDSSLTPENSGTVMDRPLHERMSAFHKSTFDDEEEKSSTTTITAPSDEPIDTLTRPEARSTADEEKRIPAAPQEPYAAPRLTPPQRVRQPVPMAVTQRPSPLRRDASVNTPAVVAPTFPNAVATRSPAESLLITRTSPILSVETVGPRRITVGKEASYQLTVSNSGEVAANDVVVFVNLPAWAEVIGSESLVGVAQPGISGNEKKPLQWKVGQLSAGGKERLTLRIVPRESRPFDLGVRWDYRPVASQTLIEVQEPKLAMHLEGPREVNYGKRELFTLRLTNTGTGDAENVAIALMPIGSNENQPATHRIGSIRAGEEKTVEIELTARQTGDLAVQVEARADGDIHVELSEKVLVRRAAVDIEIAGPSMQFVNSVAQYSVRVTNPGNTVARNVRLTAVLPPGAKYVSGIENAKLEDGGAKVHWLVDSIHSQAEQIFTIKCSLGAAGQSRLEIVGLADDDINATASAVTRVEAIADVALEVNDPSGPVAVGSEATYELRVFNRGTKTAEGVEVVAFFSNGVEPIAVEGGQHRIQPGQVAFSSIPTIAPGAEVVFKIRAKAEMAGAHVFRAEAHCKALGTRLVREETTHFYQDRPMGPSAPQTAARTPKATPLDEPHETVESASGDNFPKYGPMKR